MRLIDVRRLMPGMILANSVYYRNNLLLLSKNTVLNKAYIKKLQELKLPFVYIYDDISSDIEIYDVIDRDKVMQIYSACGHESYDLCLMVTSYIVDDLLLNIDKIPNMKKLQSFDDYTFNHCFNVATLATLVGLEFGYNEDKLQKLAMAGFMHDIGKEKIPLELINKRGKLTDEEYATMKMHPVYGYEMIKDSTSISSLVKYAILYHHENEDGSGYPDGRKGDSTHTFAKIVHVCDVYDAMISKRSYKDAINPADVIEYIYANAEHMFSMRIVQAFKNAVFPYATGSSVVLSNDKTAIVSKNYKGYPYRPDVIIPETNQTIHLRDTNTITILQVA